MTFKKTVQATVRTTLIAFAIGMYLLISVGQNSAVAAVLTETGAVSQEERPTLHEPLALESEVNRFLTSLPSGYYTISTVESLKSQLENSQAVLVDVRESAEYRAGHIPNAINIPLRTLAHNLDKVPHDRPVVLYCASGYRSAMGVMTLHLLGYENVRGFPPSLAGWQAAEEPISLLSTH